MFDPDRLDARDPDLIAAVLPYARWLNRRYLRLRASGFEALPNGPCLYVANHNSGIAGPDVLCTMVSLLDARAGQPLYALAHDFAMQHVPPFGKLVQRFGALRATPTNALRALHAGAQVLVYPGGEIDAFRHTRRRDEIVLGARTGFVRVAQQAGVPIVPIVAHGAHRSAYIFHEGEQLSRWLRTHHWARVERVPLALALPWGFAVGPWLPYWPLPFRVQLRARPPIEAPPEREPAAIREQVRAAMQAALDEMAA
ncbi:MAG TPA: 1-acyl-sn-glycerol-3-phosphate acyltransferase [Polyangiales bacterium]|nr:1-acyl-sn-glycerol-3-phosphate acyltransferase [Polyangiales bacterium]